MITKTEARERAKKYRKQLSPDSVEHISYSITDTLKKAMDWQRVHSVNVYQQIHNQNEIQTDRFIVWLEESQPHITVHKQSTQPIFPTDSFDVIIIPCLAADGQGNRVGYGGGSYDKYLKGHEEARIIALCYEDAVFDEVEAEPHDIKPHMIITEEKTRDLRGV